MKCHLVTVLSSHSLEAMVAVVASQIVQLFCALLCIESKFFLSAKIGQNIKSV